MLPADSLVSGQSLVFRSLRSSREAAYNCVRASSPWGGSRSHARKGGSMSAREIKAAHRAFAEAAVRHDLAGIASVFAIDAIIMPPEAEMVKGRDAILRHWKSAFDGGLSGLEINPTSIRVIGDMAVEIGHATLSMAPAGEAATDTSVKYIEIWKRVRGNWRVFRGMWNARSPS
jgi:uncharacterized protein (TIGR02246 family)